MRARIRRVRIDLPLVLQRDVLRAVFAAGDLEGPWLTVDLQRLRAGPGRQRDADDGDPALAFLAEHQRRFVLIADLWRPRAVAQRDHGDAARYRFVQQAGDEAVGLGRSGQAQSQRKDERAQHERFRLVGRPILA
ncbi:hypothetical protein SSTU70S_05170 [Stutzerimonas stutzeri]